MFYKECWIPGHLESRTAYESAGMLNGEQSQPNVETIEDCQKRCQKSSECYFFTYSEDGLKCYFHGKTMLKEMPGEKEYIYQESKIVLRKTLFLCPFAYGTR